MLSLSYAMHDIQSYMYVYCKYYIMMFSFFTVLDTAGQEVCCVCTCVCVCVFCNLTCTVCVLICYTWSPWLLNNHETTCKLTTTICTLIHATGQTIIHAQEGFGVWVVGRMMKIKIHFCCVCYRSHVCGIWNSYDHVYTISKFFIRSRYIYKD